MLKQNASRRRGMQGRVLRKSDLSKMLEIVLAFDRSVVESSMRLYNVSRCDRIAMRAQNRRLHRALRESLPRLLERNPSLVPKARE